ncbi:cation:proton antiporter [Agrobacterium vitis]|uniref:cation:proton antiporter n=1 Tax=Agrobacterium vitis TaxID=373 RepID=UPI001F3624E2|nr:cation:proton antiporter [Agrobacterium vitis]
MSMHLFENILLLVFIAIAFLQISRRFPIPYPTMLAIAGVLVAALPGSPEFTIDPHLALALFIAPALFDEGYDTSSRGLRNISIPLISLALIAVLLTTLSVARVGLSAGMPLAAAVALGAIVAPPDAAAAAAVLHRFDLPKRTVAILKGEGLLNDAAALLIFGVAVTTIMQPESVGEAVARFALAVPGGVVCGFVIGRAYLIIAKRLAGTLGGTLFEFAAVFGAWISAERLGVSPILTMVVFATTISVAIPSQQSARVRIHSYSVWHSTVFALNVVAFLFVGLQAKTILMQFDSERIGFALMFAASVFVVATVVRILWVLAYGQLIRWIGPAFGYHEFPTVKMSLLVSWCGMRGLITLATALALPAAFPYRDLILLSALAVVLGSLIVQGLSLAPLVKLMNFRPDADGETASMFARTELSKVAITIRGHNQDFASSALVAPSETGVTALDRSLREIHLRTVIAKRLRLNELRASGSIDDDVYREIEQELDWMELAVTPPGKLQILEG